MKSGMCMLVLGVASASSMGATIVRSSAGIDPASIQFAVDQFRADLGANNGVGPSGNTTGRREINWDGVPDSASSPNLFPGDFFNQANGAPVGRIRGAQFSTPGTGLLVSRNAAAGNVRFDDINAGYSSIFQAFSAQRIFAAQGSTITDVTFSVAGLPGVAATVAGFGAVFMDVDLDSSTSIEAYDSSNNLIFTQNVSPANNGLSFLGVSFDDGQRISRVRITAGNLALSSGVSDGFFDGVGFQDLVAMDDFIYGEPVPAPGTGLLALAAGAMLRRRRR